MMTVSSVKHLRLFGYRVEPESATVRWLLEYADKLADVEIVDLEIGGGVLLSREHSRRNLFQNVPFLEVILDRAQPYPSGTKSVSQLAPWKPDRPCTIHDAAGAVVADPNDRVLTLTEVGAIGTFLCEHFGISDLWNPKSFFQRCRSFEMTALNELLSRRVNSMVVLFILTQPYGTTQEEITAAITAHERELLWSFRQIESILIDHEKAAAAAAGLDYALLLEQGAAEVAAQEREFTAKQATGARRASEDDTVSRGLTSPTLVSLAAYIGGRTVCIADLTAAASLQLLPFLQAWLPGSLRQRNFPVMLRYLDRMRKVKGFDSILKPRLTLLRRFRRSPKIMKTDPVIQIHAARLRQILESKKKEKATGLEMQEKVGARPTTSMSRTSPATHEGKSTESNRMETRVRDTAPLVDNRAAVPPCARRRGLVSFSLPRTKTDDLPRTQNPPPNHRSDPRLLPQAHSRALSAPFSLSALSDNSAPDDQQDERSTRPNHAVSAKDSCTGPTLGHDEGDRSVNPLATSSTVSSTETVESSSTVATRGRPENMNPFHDWAARICVTPICTPCTLSEKDEEALRRSNRPKVITHSVDGRALASTSQEEETRTAASSASKRISPLRVEHSDARRPAEVHPRASGSGGPTMSVLGSVNKDPVARSRTTSCRRTRHNPYDLSTSVDYVCVPPPQTHQGVAGLLGVMDPMVAAPPTLQPPPMSRTSRLSASVA